MAIPWTRPAGVGGRCLKRPSPYRAHCRERKSRGSLQAGMRWTGLDGRAAPDWPGHVKFLLASGRLCCITLRRLFPGSSAVEQATVNRLAGGSNPSRGAKAPSHQIFCICQTFEKFLRVKFFVFTCCVCFLKIVSCLQAKPIRQLTDYPLHVLSFRLVQWLGATVLSRDQLIEGFREMNSSRHSTQSMPSNTESLTTEGQVDFIQSYLSLSRSDMVLLLRVSRPTINALFHGKSPSLELARRIRSTAEIARSLQPLSSLKVRSLIHRPVFDSKSLFDKIMRGDVNDSDIQTIKSVYETERNTRLTPKGSEANKKSKEEMFFLNSCII